MRLSNLILLAVLTLGPRPASAQADAPGVVVTNVTSGPVVEEIPLSGTVTSPQFARISAAVGGQVASVAVDAGDRVNSGDPLVLLDSEIAGIELREASAAVSQAAAQLADSRRRLADAERLVEKRSIAATEVASLGARVSIDEAAMARLEADVARRAALLARHTVRAPFDGVISSKLTESGAWITPGTAVVELVATSGLRLDFQAPQELLRRINSDSQLFARDADNQLVQATILAAVPIANPSTRSFLLRASADEHAALTPGMSATAILRLGLGRNSVRVPRDALVRYPDGRTTVWLVDGPMEAPKAREQAVETGIIAQGMVEIRDGLSDGEIIVVRGNESLQHGQTVNVIATIGE